MLINNEIQLGSSKRIQGERLISIYICAEELNEGVPKGSIETNFVIACQI
jgi:hypothetical protein